MDIKLLVYSTPINISEAKQEFKFNNKYFVSNKSFEDRVVFNL